MFDRFTEAIWPQVSHRWKAEDILAPLTYSKHKVWGSAEGSGRDTMCEGKASINCSKSSARFFPALPQGCHWDPETLEPSWLWGHSLPPIPGQGPGNRHCSTFHGDRENNSEIPFYTIISAQQKHLTTPCIDEHVEKRNFYMWLTGV